MLIASENGAERRIPATGVAAALAGGVTGALVRGRYNVLPGALVFGVSGLGVQAVFDHMIASSDSHESSSGLNTRVSGIVSRVADGKWSPFRRLSEHDYEKLLQERLLRIDAEIALIDENIGRLREKRDASQHRDKKLYPTL